MLLISEDDTVMMIKMITMKTIMKMKMMGMKPFAIALLDFFCFVFFVCMDVKSKYGCWCHLVPYVILGN